MCLVLQRKKSTRLRFLSELVIVQTLDSGEFFLIVSDAFPNQKESDRLADLYRTQLLDSPSEPELDALVKLGSRVFNAAYCLISLVDRDRLWFKAKTGLNVCESDRSGSFCTHTIQSSEPYKIQDTLTDPLYKLNPLVTGPLGLRSYLGVPLYCSAGSRIGSFCILDVTPRQWTVSEVQIIEKMGRMAELLLLKSSRSNTPKTIPGTEFNAVWTRVLVNDSVVMDETLSHLLGFPKETSVVKDWFTRQVFDCDREHVLEERCRASGEPFNYQMGLADGTVLKVCEQVKIAGQGASLHKRGEMQIHIVQRDAPKSSVLIIPDHCEFHICPDYTAKVVGDTHSLTFRLLDFLHPANIASFIQACKAVRDNGGRRSLTLQLKNHGGYFRTYTVQLSWDGGADSSTAGVFLAALTVNLQSQSMDLAAAYNASMSKALCAPGFFCHGATGQIYIAPELRKTIGLLGHAPPLDEVLVALEIFSGRELKAVLSRCLESCSSERLEFKREQFGLTHWYQILLNVDTVLGEKPNLSVFLIDVTEPRAARLDAETNSFTRDLILQNMSDGLLEFDNSNLVVFANSAARKCILGAVSGFVAGTSIQTLLPGLTPAALSKALSEMRYQGASESYELYVPTTGKLIKTKFIRGHNASYCVINDVTSQHRNQQQLSFAEQALALSESPVVLLELNAESTDTCSVVYVNDAFGNRFNRDPDSILNADPEWFAVATFGSSGVRKLTQAIMKWQNASVQLQYLDPNGVSRSCVVEVRPSTEVRSSTRHVLLVLREPGAYQ